MLKFAKEMQHIADELDASDREFRPVNTVRGAPVCADCNGTIDDQWWNYCAICGKYLAAGNDVKPA